MRFSERERASWPRTSQPRHVDEQRCFSKRRRDFCSTFPPTARHETFHTHVREANRHLLLYSSCPSLSLHHSGCPREVFGAREGFMASYFPTATRRCAAMLFKTTARFLLGFFSPQPTARHVITFFTARGEATRDPLLHSSRPSLPLHHRGCPRGVFASRERVLAWYCPTAEVFRRISTHTQQQARSFSIFCGARLLCNPYTRTKQKGDPVGSKGLCAPSVGGYKGATAPAWTRSWMCTASEVESFRHRGRAVFD